MAERFEPFQARRLGLLALGDSITRGDGEPALGVPARSWALWLAEAYELPYTNLAVDGALAVDVLATQLPRVRADYDLACCYVGVNDARALDWDAARFEAELERVLLALRERAMRVLSCTIPLDLGRPRAGAKVAAANAIVRALAARHGALVVDLADLRGWRLVQPDAVHVTALGQLEIASRAAATLAAAGWPPPRPPRGLTEPHRSRRARARFAARWGALLVRDLVRRLREALGRRMLREALGRRML